MWHLISVAAHRGCGSFLAARMEAGQDVSPLPRKPKVDLDHAQTLTYLFMYIDPFMIPFLELSEYPLIRLMVSFDICTHTVEKRSPTSWQLMLIWHRVYVTKTNLVFQKWCKTENTTALRALKTEFWGTWLECHLITFYFFVITEQFSIF